MYLKRIEIQGFKSFANKTVLEFENGITGIVGPNGSGKSNIADAVRWVLGEQRIKQLRGGVMQDVIFSGTENRRPLSYAMVAITLDNTDHSLPAEYEEITVTRRLYRSGESEYLINGTLCRLKDISELFYDTGIGKEGYSIIGQGQIEKIVSGKPEEKRELFDEAAGIVKYKKRKALTQKKFEAEDSNLVRINDILSELEKQYAPLENQSKKAKTYLNKKEELKKYDINMFLIENQKYEEQFNELKKAKHIADAQYKESSDSFLKAKALYDEVDEELEAVDFEIEDASRKLNQTNILTKELEGQIALLREQINTAKLNDEFTRERYFSLKEEIEARSVELEGVFRDKISLETELSASSTRIQDISGRENDLRNDITSREEAKAQAQATRMSLVEKRAGDQASLQKCDLILESNALRIDTLTGEICDRDEEAKTLILKLQEAGKDLGDVVTEKESKISELRELEVRLREIREQIKANETGIRELESQVNKENSRLEYLKGVAERYEGYGNSIRHVMNRRDKVKGIYGVVADIVKTDKKYELAIETALGGSIQNIIVDTEATAKQLIGFLKENRYGRATFLPLSAANYGKEFDRRGILDERGVIDLASNLVRCDEIFSNVVRNLLGRIVVTDNIDNAVAVARKYKYSFRIVTLDGESLSPGGSLTGGAFKNSSNLLSRRREIKDLEARVNNALGKLDRLKEGQNRISAEKDSISTSMDVISGEIHVLDLKINTSELDIKNLERMKESALEEIRERKSEIEKLKAQNQTLNDTKAEYFRQVEGFEREDEASTLKIERLDEEILELKAELESVSEVVGAARLELNTLSQKQMFMEENEARLKAEIQRLNQEICEIDLSNSQAVDSVKEKEAAIADYMNEIAESGEIVAELKEIIDSGNAKKEELNRKHRSFITQRENLQSTISELEKELLRIQNRTENVEANYDRLITYMWEEYEITPVLASKLKDETLTNLTEIRQAVNRLRKEIKELGHVNVDAIEEFRALSERYRFVSKQRDDIVEAKDKLEEIITELDEGMRRQFETNFKAISREFNRVFAILFGGGKGSLELVDEEDILESGIAIIAQPPGKKLQNMMQLSGGEKSLTAIALLMAIQNMKPSPFCLLDEIEAALDDANVKRFAEYLKLLTAHTQFIMITHRRGTMAACDRLYGITMQEKGISTLVSVDFSDSDEVLFGKEERKN